MNSHEDLLKKFAKMNGERYISNEEFFSSNGKGCFYEGFDKDEDGNYQPNEETKRQRWEEEDKQYPCFYCGSTSKSNCCDE